jgi:hypothetical protein
VTREEAQRTRDRMAEEHPEATWLVTEQEPGKWSVVKVGLTPPGGAKGEAIESRPNPPNADDPRPGHDRNVGGPWIGG